jgi:hypothetical protein
VHTGVIGAAAGLLLGLLIGLVAAGGDEPPKAPAGDTKTKPALTPPTKPCAPCKVCEDVAPKAADPGPVAGAKKPVDGKAAATKAAATKAAAPTSDQAKAAPPKPRKLSRRQRRALRKWLRKAKRAYRRRRYTSALIYALRAKKVQPASSAAEKLRLKISKRLGL